MKKRFRALLAVLPSLAVPAAGKVPSGAVGTVQYEVRYKLGGVTSKVATATISLESAKWEDNPAYHTRAVIKASSVFRLFMNAEYLADAYISTSGLEPLFFTNPFKKNGKECKIEYVYDSASRLIRSETVRPPSDPVSETFPLDGRTLDLLSLLQYVRFQEFSDGKPVSLHLLMSGKSCPATLTLQGVDTERFPDMPAERFLLKMNGRGLMENGSGDEITVWRSTGSDRRILGLETALGSSATMSVSVKP